MTKANGWKPSTIIKENFTSDLARVLDPTLTIIKMVHTLNELFEKLVLKQSRPSS